MTDRITPERQKEFMARTLVGMVLYNKREFTDEECAVYNSILALLDQSAPMLMGLRGIAPDATGDLSSEEFVRRVREGWTPPWKKPAPTDEERGEMVALLSDLEEDPSYHWFEQWGNKMGKLAGKIRALLQSPPKVSVDMKDVNDLLIMLIDCGPLWYRGNMPEDGKAISIIFDWLRDLGITVEEEKNG